MTIIGYQFDKAKVTALKDSVLYHHLANRQNYILQGFGREMRVTTSGLTARVDVGLALVCGRLIEITAPESVTIPVNSRGYLVLYIDLSQENVASGTAGYSDYHVDLRQISVRFVTSLTQQDILQGGLIYTFNLGQVSSTTTSVSFTANADAVLKKEWRTKRQIPIGYGANATLYRDGNRVRLELAGNRTGPQGNGTQRLAERIPEGYRPRINTTTEAVVMVGPNVQLNKTLKFVFTTDGTVYSAADGMNQAPLNVTANVEWVTNDDGVASDSY